MDAQTNTYVHADGTLTEVFKNELRDLRDDELEKLEEKIKGARHADTDLFGIKRRVCQVCEESCIGYQANKILFSSGREQKGEFPTFCKHCGCPAYWHKVEEEHMDFPEDLAEQLVSKNIQSQDLNFNCVLAAFMIKNDYNAVENVTEISTLLQDEGLEIVSSG